MWQIDTPCRLLFCLHEEESDRMQRGMHVETLLTPLEISRYRSSGETGGTAVVFDVLRATTSIVTGLAHGVARVIPVETIEEALAWRDQDPGVVLGGERQGNRIEGFAVGNSPAEYTNLPGATVVTTTTNGTVAIRACAQADEILIGSLLNLRATAQWIARTRPDRVRILCAGTFDQFALEDAVAAGVLVRAWEEVGLELQLCDATRAVRALVDSAPEIWSVLLQSSRNARALLEAGRGADITFALQRDRFPVVVRWDGEACLLVTPPENEGA